ncbi:hypothetical protein AMS68_003086 [Peltaster fructicola]|uniref:Uncharacterized protein n=1 Tax=Peltaster fructicola TaxID=286661 RepID=A0A6H0XSH2_9PEZI|nr:hypothetical protein AMS68_003086 [Peltaster fructicola]
MPELPHFNPSVSVFHFTSKVSSAKIAKYKLATERGMVVSHAPAKENTKPLKRSASTSSLEPKKRPRLKLSVRNPAPTDPDTITVSRPRQSTTAPPTKNGRAETEVWSSRTHHTHEPKTRCPATTATKDDYGAFMSYYVLDDDNDKPLADVSSKTKAPQRANAKHTSDRQAWQNANRYRQDIPQQHQRPQPQWHPPSASLSMAPALTAIRARDPDPVPVMIKKLESLSAALTDFGGVPHIPQSPVEEDGELNLVSTLTNANSLLDEESPVDNFLAMFGEAPTHEKQITLPLNLEELIHPGFEDQALIHGIQFIMNALNSWAQQRLAQQVAQQMQRPSSGGNKQSPFDVERHQQHMQLPDPSDTPEGRAISAFRAVVESGCLRANSVLPLKLAKAVRLLYMQIDHLINQNNKVQPPWRCLSYVAQIEANRIRVEKWREAQAKAQEEMIRQQQLSHQQMMRQMGLPDHLTSTMFYHQSGDHETPEHERRNSSTDLLALSVEEPRPAAARNASLSRSASTETPHPEHGKVGPSAGYLPRSGQSMTFSFAPETAAAIHAFGADAFPQTSPLEGSTPNLGVERHLGEIETVKAVPGTEDSKLNIVQDRVRTAASPQESSVASSRGWAPINKRSTKHN